MQNVMMKPVGSWEILSRFQEGDLAFAMCITYTLFVQKKRDELLKYLNDKGVEAKVHYPIPVHLQEAARYLGYKKGDFPVSEVHAKTAITLPAHQHLTSEEIEYVIENIRQFYLG